MSSVANSLLKHRPFLKWAGGKFRLTDEINKLLPKNKKVLIEPFVGAGSVFLNTHFQHYILADLNADLINLFNTVKQDPQHFIVESRKLFQHPDANSADFYYAKRAEFNRTLDIFQRSVLFLYLNRFGYNGLCRYNSKQQFNVPFGAYLKPYFPEQEIRYFSQKAQNAEFICVGFHDSFEYTDRNSVVYCDPPYAPLSQNSNFTHYAGNGFSLEQQQQLANLAKHHAEHRRTTVLISNHDTPFTRQIYHGADITPLMVQRHISQNGENRIKVNELIAIFRASRRKIKAPLIQD
ncbi:Dam family site-specific DNA-(adenine-N6)-methyltransferase [Testudinibacter sp. TR-2022]|uniref:Dam family site-specific DNA-(adenine-N6)-methyltransferase n=1 Tax=Testudinibacter sp. TR-2022 TaxID=2585029 RepID=UPI00111A17AA|nr:Dam family site-specific DNA-(adenine-N6)-methyltransferase [Testudinibacter sp. TR-2022]TNH04022.1 Dam family site-specific DNA-(adenine-N6)-methyltransferase [Pasteurellaceae bacterium Phil31]TNH08790.1 Dam family site-specific DNA-(adenine-N6)-methyltransferase [Testudinibacter sp. TR-2022]TNH11426.1 Dam family site-specific DNA-(adenine-N6)-methyltransferase [Testudinibacter sp. TR-2022]TNH11466.1 Dam family site-specific DNA-(adenine-N6)-methyltransferase [Testudinibacter sp. TR-2022]T